MFGLFLVLGAFFQTAKPFVADVPTKYTQAAPPANQTVATVDGVEIKAKDVEDLLWQWRGADAVRELVEYQMAKAEADRQGIKITVAEAEAKLKESLDGFAQQAPGKDIDDLLQQQGFTRSRAFLRVSRELMIEKMAEKGFHEADFVKVSAITIKPSDQKSLDQALTEAKGAYDKLLKGQKWAAVLATTTNDPNVIQDGGLLGWRALRIFPESTVKEIAPLKAGAYTKPVQTTAGVQIFRIEAKGNEVPSEQVAELKNQYLTGAMPALEKQIRDKAKITSYQPAKKQ